MSAPTNEDCPLCGYEVSAEDERDIGEGMEFDNRTCPACGLCYWEVREQQEPDE